MRARGWQKPNGAENGASAMTDAEVEALATAARAATPGEWFVISPGNQWRVGASPDKIVADTYERDLGHADTFNAAHIAAANPAAVLRLIARLRDAEAEAARFRFLDNREYSYGTVQVIEWRGFGPTFRAAIDAAMKEQGA